MHSAILVADYMIVKNNCSLTPLQIIELVYISHCYTLGIKHHPLIHDRVEAWSYGPVIPSLYWQLYNFGDKPVTRLLYSGIDVTDAFRMEKQKNFLSDELGECQTILNKVLRTFGVLSGRKLLEITNKLGSPWNQCYVQGRTGVIIPDYITEQYYEMMLELAPNI